MAGNRFEIATIFKAVDKMTAPISRMQSKLATFTRSAQTGLKGVTKAAGGLTRAVGLASVLSIGALTAGVTNATAAGIDFEQTLVNAAAKFSGDVRKGTKEFAALEAAAISAGSTTEFTATKAAEALNYLAMVGMDTQTSVAVLPGLIDLATASQTDLATATDIATDTMGAFNMQAKNAAESQRNLVRVSDVMAMTANTSNTDMEKLFETLKKGGPVATMAGASFETVAAQAGIMANAGIKAEIAGTAIANSFLNLSNPTGAAAKVVQRLGLRLKQSNGALKDLPDLIDEVNRKTAKLTKTQKQAAIEALFGREGLAGNVAVLAAGGDALRKYRAQLEGASGSTSKMAKVMRDTTRGSLNNLTSAIEGVSIKLFGMTGGPIKDVIDRTTEWVRANGDVMASGIGEFVLKLADNFDKLLIAAKVVGGLVAAIWILNSALTVANALAALNPFVLLAMAIAGAAVAIYTNWDAIKSYFSDLWEDTLAGFRNLWDGIKAMSADAMAWLGQQWDGFINQWISRINRITSVFGADPIALRVQAEKPLPPNDMVNGDVPAFEMVTPQQRTAQTLNETRTTNTTEVVIRDETTHSSVTQTGGKTPGLILKPTGGF